MGDAEVVDEVGEDFGIGLEGDPGFAFVPGVLGRHDGEGGEVAGERKGRVMQGRRCTANRRPPPR